MRILKNFSTFLQESTGASMVEFALVLPLLMTISLGIYETSNYILLSQRLNEIAASVANWVSSKTTAAEISDSFIGANLIGKDYNFSTNGGVVVTGLQQSGPPIVTSVVWQRSTSGATSGITTNSSGNVVSSPFPIASEPQMIVVEVSYSYTPTFSYFLNIFPPIKLQRASQMISRSGLTFNPLPPS